MKLLIKQTDARERKQLLVEFLRTAWDIQIVDEKPRESFAAALKSADAIVSMNWSAETPSAPVLRLIHLPGAGTDEIDFSAVPQGATVCNVYEHETGIAEYVLATMLEWVIGVRKMDAALRRGSWQGSWMCGPQHRELAGQVVGILGYGRIGREIARRASAFGTRVIACSRTPRSADGLAERIVGMSGLERLLTESDFVVISMPLDRTTKGLLDARAFETMKSTAVVINIARGPIIDERALYEACRNRRIGGAIIDTWYSYPAAGECHCAPSMYPFHELDNVVMTPHGSAWTEGLLRRRCRVIADNLDRLAMGEALANVVTGGI